MNFDLKKLWKSLNVCTGLITSLAHLTNLGLTSTSQLWSTLFASQFRGLAHTTILNFTDGAENQDRGVIRMKWPYRSVSTVVHQHALVIIGKLLYWNIFYSRAYIKNLYSFTIHIRTSKKIKTFKTKNWSFSKSS